MPDATARLIVAGLEFVDVRMDAPSLEGQRGFYGDVLGLPIAGEGADEVAFQAGRTRIRFRHAQPGEAPTYHFAFRVPGNRFKEAKSWLAGRTELLRDGGSDEFDWSFWGARAVYARDPAGNVVELIAFADLPADGSGPDTILGLAELGLPAADVRAAVGALADTFGIGLWDRAEITQERLVPIGERGATFLIVPVGRRWHLGGPAGAYPLEVKIEGVPEASLELSGHPYSIRGIASPP